MIEMLKRLFDGRTLLAKFLEILASEPREVIADPAQEVYELRKELGQRVRVARQIEIERDCFREELLRRGLSMNGLVALVKMYDNKLHMTAGVRRRG